MSEPKEPPNLGEASAPKKASKKSTSKRAVDDGNSLPLSTSTSTPSPATSQLSSAAVPKTPMSPVSVLYDVPRLAIADPKGPTVPVTSDGASDGAERKVRAAKKRTSAPDAEPSASEAGPSLPSAAAAKSDADVEKEKAKREAKRHRQHEIEEQRKREEMERVAVEEARKKEEQRQREMRRQHEQSALNANADVVQEEEEEDGYGDDGFEEYGDDFEDGDAPPAKTSAFALQAKPQAKTKGVHRDNGASALDAGEFKRIQEAQKAESKELSSASRHSSKATSKAAPGGGDVEEQTPTTTAAEAKKRASPATSIAASIAGLKQSLDPRARRAKEIRDARKFDVEKFNVFVQAPMAEVDIYLARLRRGNVRQVAVQTKEDDKAAATQTKVAELIDKSMHFPDDIGIDDVATRFKLRAKRRDNQADGELSEEQDEEEDEDEVTSVSSMRFLNFLEQSSLLCEQLIEEDVQESDLQHIAAASKRDGATIQLSKQSAISRVQLFPSKLAQFKNEGVVSLLKGRSLASVQFSPTVSNTLITWYSDVQLKSSPECEEVDSEAPSTRSEKSIGIVWDINQLDQVLYVLRSEDRVTASSLGPTRGLFVLAGTEDGAVNVWDLRSRLGLVGRRYSIVHKLDLYSPTYSTCGADSRSVEGSHQSPIVAIDIIDGNAYASGMFQFGSLDDRGMLLIWSTIDYSSASDANALLLDKCVEVGGRIKLVVSVAIDTQLQYLVLTRPALRAHVQLASGRRRTGLEGRVDNGSLNKTTEQALEAELSVGPIATVFKFLPREPNVFLVGTTTGIVLRGNRFQHTRASGSESAVSASVECYRRDHHAVVAAPTPVGIAVTTIAFHPFEPDYFLAGYEDGRVCLFDVGLTAAVATWEEVDSDQSVVSLQWSPSRPGVFFASYSHGLVHAWDLTAQRHAPAIEHRFGEKDSKAGRIAVAAVSTLSLSSEKIRTSRPCIALSSASGEPFGFEIHELGPEFTTKAPREQQTIQQILVSIF